MTTDALRKATPEEQYETVTRATVDIQVPEELKKKLQRSYDTGKPLVIKTGFDPSRPDLHLGHSLLLTRMRRFQEFGHTVVFLIGDFTGLIGDPTGRNATRPALTRDEVKANAETYKQQVFKVLDPDKTVVRFNSTWLDALGTEGMIRLAARYSVQRMLERDDFKKRFRENTSISIHEFLYPLLQGYDSVALKSDVELGATDQLFNLLVGRQLMKEEGLEPQVIMTGPILEGLDAKLVDGKIVGNKMSKSLDNYVGIDEPPETIFGKLMSITDDLMWRYLELLSATPLKQVAEMRAKVQAGELHPMTVKKDFAREMAVRFHGEEGGRKAVEAWDNLKKEASQTNLELVEVSLAGAEKQFLFKLLPETKLVTSATKAREAMAQGSVRVNGEKVMDLKAEYGPGEYVVQVGKARTDRPNAVRLKLT
ncbi:tyrosine--tRNA ligase [Pyxidicoccus parkwayensis]|uniref:Tyrosine--tRNA ligase n=1 Tax=Pyxidicoccus parkwayensis TaxID=2813578 RepID=A0ABX7PAE4_9BACT|nr:tyrosine--tRNA ligase [Pyxidicoccus parkwaysis]QSQ27388.1 tyrosine--tRNA ligase [Pyxidicoccus parkwaysis]